VRKTVRGRRIATAMATTPVAWTSAIALPKADVGMSGLDCLLQKEKQARAASGIKATPTMKIHVPWLI
jgi:hypothetical protein